MFGEFLQTGMAGLEAICGTESHGENSGIACQIRNYLKGAGVKPNFFIHISDFIIS